MTDSGDFALSSQPHGTPSQSAQSHSASAESAPTDPTLTQDKPDLDATTQSKPLREKLIPQTSLRFFLVLIGVSAGVMVVFRVAFLQESYWAKVLALMFAVTTTCFLSYAALFLLANLFSVSTRPLRSALSKRGDVKEPIEEAG